MIKKPQVPQSFFYGDIESWIFRSSITKSHDAYCIRFTLTFTSGDTCNKQVGGFKTIESAARAKDELIVQLSNHEYIPFKYNIKECFDYWLYYYMPNEKQISSNTFSVYHNVLYNYFLKHLTGKVADITIEQLARAILSIKSSSVQQSAISVAYSFFKFARTTNVINFDPSKAAVQIVKNQIKSEKDLVPKKSRLVYNMEQVKMLLYNCKLYFPDIYLPLLFSLTLGTRISETIALKYSDIDFTNQWMYVNKQLGRKVFESELSEIKTKSKNGIRKIPLPTFVLDEVIIKRKWYEDQLQINDNFSNHDYICCQKNGKPLQREYLRQAYYQLINRCGLHKITWHDLRHTYATILNDEINLKALSIFLGHARPEFSFDVYVYHEPAPVYDCSLHAIQLWEKVKPTKNISHEEQILEIKPDMEIIKNILPKTIK